MGVIDEKSIELDIEGLASGGRGVARHDGVVWFVTGGLPGDRVLAAPRVRRSRYVEAEQVGLLRPSPDRRAVSCPVQERCGACPWMPLEEELQRDWKRRQVQDALERIGGLSGTEVDPVLARGPGLGYRNKVELTLGLGPAGEPVLGFHGNSSDGGIVDVACCPVQHEGANFVLQAARRLLLDPDGPWKAAFKAKDVFRLVLRRSWLTGEILVALREAGNRFPDLELFAQQLAEVCPEVQGVVRIVARPGRRGGARVERVLGRDWIDERVGELTFRLPALSFLQVSTVMAAELVRVVAECASPAEGSVALDLYGGVGSIGLHLALRGARVTVCEADRTAVACGRRAARKAGLSRATFVTGDVRDFLASAAPPWRGAETIVANPPRDGLGRGVADAILARKPDQVILVSCDPPTLARDLGRLVRGGLVLARVIPLDMFPQTSHIETVVQLKRARPVS